MTKHPSSPSNYWTILIVFGPSTAFILAIVFAMAFMPADSEGIFKDSLHCSPSEVVSEIEVIHGSATNATSPTAARAGDAADTAM